MVVQVVAAAEWMVDVGSAVTSEATNEVDDFLSSLPQSLMTGATASVGIVDVIVVVGNCE